MGAALAEVKRRGIRSAFGRDRPPHPLCLTPPTAVLPCFTLLYAWRREGRSPCYGAQVRYCVDRSLRAFVGVLLASTFLTTSALPSAHASVWPSSHKRVAEALKSDDLSKRRSAAGRLLELPPKLARGLAIHALRDADEEVRLFGARAAAALGVAGAGDEVIDWLQASDARLRAAACTLIEASPTPRSVTALARVLGDAKATVRRAAASAMGSSGMSDAVSPLLGHLDDGSSAVRFEVVRALGRIGDQRAVVPLVSKFHDQSSNVRREAARALGQLGDKRATAPLMLALRDASPAVRVQALEALGKLIASDAVPAIASLLSSVGSDAATTALAGPVRNAALRALGRIRTPESVKLLVDALRKEGPIAYDSHAAAPARRALLLAGKDAIKALIATLDASPSPHLASAAVLTLGLLEARSAVPAILRATQRGTVALDASLQSLERLGDDRALPFVLEHLDDADARIRRVAVSVASGLLEPGDKDGRAVDVVRARVLDLSAPLGERIALVRLLGRTGSPRASKLVLSLAKTKPTALRIAAVQALGELGAPSDKVDAALLDAIGEQSRRLRSAAAWSLAQVGGENAARKLLHRLGVSAEQDRGAIGIALSGALARSATAALVEQVGSALGTLPGRSRDALIEGLGRMKSAAAGQLLAKLTKSPDVDDRRKVAEALAGHADHEPSLLALLRDPDATVRANATWSLGSKGSAAAIKPLQGLLTDLDVSVAGNATIALARVGARNKQPAPPTSPPPTATPSTAGSSAAGSSTAGATNAAPPAGAANAAPPAGPAAALCAVLSDYRPYVRAGALAGLRLLGSGCAAGKIRHLLARDRSWRARLAAAELLLAVSRSAPSPAAASNDAVLDRRALTRCAVEDRDASVAARCAEKTTQASTAITHEVLVYVVPDGKTAPVARAPFALALSDGTMRLGVADRRGALFERSAPDGPLTLAVPAALAP